MLRELRAMWVDSPGKAHSESELGEEPLAFSRHQCQPCLGPNMLLTRGLLVHSVTVPLCSVS